MEAGPPGAGILASGQRTRHDFSNYQISRQFGVLARNNNKLPKGGHFAAWEQPGFYSEELRAGFKSLRNKA